MTTAPLIQELDHGVDGFDPTQLLFTVEEAARRLRIGPTLCRSLIRTGELESVTVVAVSAGFRPRPSRTMTQLLADAGERDGRLHGARHTAWTVLLLHGVPDVVVDAILGRGPGGSDVRAVDARD